MVEEATGEVGGGEEGGVDKRLDGEEGHEEKDAKKERDMWNSSIELLDLTHRPASSLSASSGRLWWTWIA